MASCSYTVPTSSQMDTSGDNFYANRLDRWQAFYDWAWDAFDFDEGDWNEGFGHEDPWNRTKPLARTMAALYCLVYSAGAGNRDPGNWGPDPNILQWGWWYAAWEIDELDALCASGNRIAYTRYGIIIDNYTNLYLKFFYDQGVVQRAGTIIHEARHASWKGHDDDPYDSSWDYNGAWRWHVVWLWWFYVEARGATSALKLQAKQKANAILSSKFTQDPGFRVS